MEPPLRISFRHTDRSPLLESHAREFVERLSHLNTPLRDCRVVIEGPSRRRDRRGAYTVKFELVVSGGAIHASNEQSTGRGQADPLIAMTAAYENAKRQLLSFA